MIESRAVVEGILVIGSAIIGGVTHSIVIKRNILPKLAIPLDGGYKISGKPIFGQNKTWRGVVVMVIGVTLGSVILKPHGGQLLVGILIALGYLLGELPNSFLKRRLGIAPGRKSSSWFYLLDQTDSTIGIVLILFFTNFLVSWAEAFVIIVGGTIVHILFDSLLYTLRVKR